MTREQRLAALLREAQELLVWMSAGGSERAHDLIVRIEEGLVQRPEDVVASQPISGR